MALLSPDEQAKLKRQGYIVRECCDNPECRKPILELSYTIPVQGRKKIPLTFCSKGCRTVISGLPAPKIREKHKNTAEPLSGSGKPSKTVGSKPTSDSASKPPQSHVESLILSILREQRRTEWTAKRLTKAMPEINSGWSAKVARELVRKGKLTRDETGLYHLPGGQIIEKQVVRKGGYAGDAE